MNKLEIIRHGDLSIKEVLEIIDIKSIAWPYDADSQFRWMIRNLRENDLHFLLRNVDRQTIVAYLNLVEIKAIFEDGRDTICWGLGNVCSREKGKGTGREIMSMLNDFVLTSGHPALLLCKEPVIGFYSKMGWREIKNMTGMSPEVHVMILGEVKEPKLYKVNRVF